MGQHFLAILGALAVDKRHKEWQLTISIAFSVTWLLRQKHKLNL